MECVKFYKYTAAGNDFVLFDRKEIGEVVFTEKEIIRMCDRHFGVGADGILVVSESAEFDFDLKFFNPDGTSGMLCANGARCAVSYAGKSGYFDGNKAVFSVNGKTYSGEILDENKVILKLEDFEVSVKALFVDAGDVSANGFFVDAGAPHFLIDVSEAGCKSVEEADVEFLGKKFGEDKTFQPEETNVGFIETSNGRVKLRTYERGVRRETLSCGTGAIAAGLTASSVYGIAAPIEIEMPGGTLIVDFNSVEESVSLTGKVNLIFEGKFYK
ncbi:MAG: diaminopimelate epimerase [Chlorobi bacterium]|nr:diaminopimelate epimerase [Chlorobiota bacterium]